MDWIIGIVFVVATIAVLCMKAWAHGYKKGKRVRVVVSQKATAYPVHIPVEMRADDYEQTLEVYQPGDIVIRTSPPAIRAEYEYNYVALDRWWSEHPEGWEYDDTDRLRDEYFRLRDMLVASYEKYAVAYDLKVFDPKYVAILWRGFEEFEDWIDTHDA